MTGTPVRVVNDQARSSAARTTGAVQRRWSIGPPIERDRTGAGAPGLRRAAAAQAKTAVRSSVISSTAKAGPSRVLPESRMPP
jgi:hypothetical protein